MYKLINFFIFIWLIISVSFFAYNEYNYLKPNINHQKIKASVEQIKFPKNIFKETLLKDISNNNNNIKLNAWIPSWGIEEGLNSLMQNINNFESISPVFYLIDEKGNITKDLRKVEEIKKITSRYNVKLIPTISSFNPDALSINLNKLDELNKFLIREIEEHDFDGVDLNYESIYTKDNALFFNHLEFLSKELKLRKKLLYVTVLSKWGDNINYSFAPQTRKVQDYQKISSYADQIRIMTYDYTPQSSLMPGPIAPLKWVEEVLIYATNRVDPKKISLGIHLYGYIWSFNKESKAFALNYREIAQIKNSVNNVHTLFKTDIGENIIFYSYNKDFFFGYYSSPEMIKERIEIAKKYGLQNVSFWRLGNDPL